MSNIKVVAFDLDGTLTQHKSPLSAENRAALDQLAKRYKLLMAGAGMCQRIFNQMGKYPIDIIGNYGMQYAEYQPGGTLKLVKDMRIPCNRDSVEARVTALRRQFGFTEYTGDNVEYHDSGCVTFPILGTAAKIEDKLSFDPDRSKRRAILAEVQGAFPEFTVFVGGSSSFDMSPAPYNKYYALDEYCREHGLRHGEVAYVGDDYGPGGNDACVYQADFVYFKIDDYRTFPQVIAPLLD